MCRECARVLVTWWPNGCETSVNTNRGLPRSWNHRNQRSCALKYLLATILSAAMLLGTMPAAALESTFSEEIFDLWSEAYASTELQDADHELWEVQEENARASREADSDAFRADSHSLTPSLDRLLGSSAGAVRGQPALQPGTAPRSRGHETFFENPPMTPQSKGFSSWSGDDDGSSYSDRHHRNSCGHYGSCGCNNPPPPTAPPATPTPEPGTLLLAGLASAAALAARRRAHSKAAAAG